MRPRLIGRRERLDQILECDARRSDLVAIVAAGGDGTVGDVVNRFPGVPIAILPLGTENLLSRYLGIPCSGRIVAEMIAQRHTRSLDLCALNDRRFVLMASFGFDADVVSRTHSRRRGHITRWNYLQPILESAWTYGHPELRVFVDGASQPITGRLAVIVNLPMYALGLQFASSARGDDGLMDLRLFQGGSTFAMLRYLYTVATGAHEMLSDVLSLRAARVWIEADKPVPIQVDGDPAGCTPADICTLPGALRVFVPAQARSPQRPAAVRESVSSE
jgi:diacylglycerol kinase family enzyme